MKEGIHPDYHEITVVMTDGTEVKTRSTYGKKGEKLRLEVDRLSHPAWVGGTLVRKTDQVTKFSKKFGAFTDSGEGDKK